MDSRDISYFNLFDQGDNAVVRLLHKSVNSIESASTHKVTMPDGKNKIIKCCGEGCPICAKGDNPTSRIYVHLFDYTDNKEKVWCRTDKIIEQFKSIENDWGDLSNCVVKITRLSKDFPKYDVAIMPPHNYITVDSNLIDEKVSYRFYATRSIDEINEFYKTGILPAHKSNYVPKEEYYKAKEAAEADTAEAVVSIPPLKSNDTQNTADTTGEVFDPFVNIGRR